ncbi:MAG: FtsX-like permease family protein [Opitutales bacterium]
MKVPWNLYLAFKQLFPTGRGISFFSVLAIVGVALGVNVMIVVVAFMKGFQSQFRNDLMDTYGEIHVRSYSDNMLATEWRDHLATIEADPAVAAVTPYMHGFVFLQGREEGRVSSTDFPIALGVDAETIEKVLPISKFIRKAMRTPGLEQYELPEPSLDELDDSTIFVHSSMGMSGIHPPLVAFDANASRGNAGDGRPKILRVAANTINDIWRLTFEDATSFRVSAELQGPEPQLYTLGEGPFLIAGGLISFDLEPSSKPFRKGDTFRFEIIEASTVDLYGPVIMERAEDEAILSREVRVAGFFETSWLPGGGNFTMLCTLRLMGELNGREGLVGGFNVRLQPGLAQSELEVFKVAQRLGSAMWPFGYQVLPWFEIKPWFHNALKFEEKLMILIMVPTVLVSAFAIAIALMTSVVRKTREIGLLVAMGGTPRKVGAVFQMQGFVIGLAGTLAGWSLACLMIGFRHEMMEFIVPLFTEQLDVEQYYHFFSLKVYQPWESPAIAETFLWAGLFGVGVSTLAGRLPAWRAASLKPAEALRSE